LLTAQAIVTTCTGAGHDVLQDQCFEWILIDEATQATEPSTLVPICSRCSFSARSLCLLGDPLQLPPTLLSMKALQLGLNRSLFERLMQQGLQPGLLDVQFRMHPSISEFPAMHFYKGLVRTGVEGSSRTPISGFDWPHDGERRVAFVAVSEAGKDKGKGKGKGKGKHATSCLEEMRGHSYRNTAEAEVLMQVLSKILEAVGTSHSASISVAVVAPYSAQRSLIENRLRNVSNCCGCQVRVATVDALQGSECDLVLFSATRSNPSGSLGFVADARRANVALTRARRGVIVFGDPETLRSDRTWGSWLSWATSAMSDCIAWQ
jgi:regulator of nonsense transcripts 1